MSSLERRRRDHHSKERAVKVTSGGGGGAAAADAVGDRARLGHVSRIPWTKEETEHVQELLEYLSLQLQEAEEAYSNSSNSSNGSSSSIPSQQRALFPREECKRLLKVLQEFLNQEDLDRNDPLLSKIAYYFNEVQCVNLDKVAQLLQRHKGVGEQLEDQDVILLLGSPSCGKTTTLHCLAGTTFEEADVDGFVHLQPTQFLDASVAAFETSCSRKAVTRTLQTTTVNMYEHNFVVCDTPGFGFFHDIEEEIAHSHGMVEALCHARTIRPVFVLSQECLGNRLSGFPGIFSMMTSYFSIPQSLGPAGGGAPAPSSHEHGVGDDDEDEDEDIESLEGEGDNSHTKDNNSKSKSKSNAIRLSAPPEPPLPFQYVFTRFDDRHRTRLCKMLKYLHETVDSYDEEMQGVFTRVVDDIVDKTTPEAIIISPISDIPRYLLRQLLENDKLVCEPREWMKPYTPEPTKRMLHAQLKLSLYGILMFLANQDYEGAVERVRHLKDLSDVLYDAQAYYDMAIKACRRYAIILCESFHERMQERDFGSGFAHVTQSTQLTPVLLLPDDHDNTMADSDLQLTYKMFWEKLTEITVKTRKVMTLPTARQLKEMCKYNTKMQGEMKRGIRVVRNSILKDITKEDDCTKASMLLMQLIQLAHVFKDAAQSAADLLERMEQRLMERIRESDFRKATEDLIAMGPIVHKYPDRMPFAIQAVKMYKQELERSIDKQFYDATGDLLLDLTQLQVYYPAADKFMAKGLEKLWKVFGYAIKQREYCTAVCIVKHMSKVAHVSATAYDRSRLGIEVIRDRLFKSIQNKNYSMAQTLLEQLNKLEKLLPKSMKPKVRATTPSGDKKRHQPRQPEISKKQQQHPKQKQQQEHRHHQQQQRGQHYTARYGDEERHDSPERRPLRSSRVNDVPDDIGSSIAVEEGIHSLDDDFSELTMTVDLREPADAGPSQNFPKVIKSTNHLTKYTKPSAYDPTTTTTQHRPSRKINHYPNPSAPATKHRSSNRHESSPHKRRHFDVISPPPAKPHRHATKSPPAGRHYKNKSSDRFFMDEDDDDDDDEYRDDYDYNDRRYRERGASPTEKHHHHSRNNIRNTRSGREDFSAIGSRPSHKEAIRQVDSMLSSVVTGNSWDV